MCQFDHFSAKHRKCFNEFRKICYRLQSAQRFWYLMQRAWERVIGIGKEDMCQMNGGFQLDKTRELACVHTLSLFRSNCFTTTISASNKTRVTEFKRERAARTIAVRSHNVSSGSKGSFANISHNLSIDNPVCLCVVFFKSKNLFMTWKITIASVCAAENSA